MGGHGVPPLQLLVELCVLEEPHRFVLEIPVQSELVHEVWVECEATGQHELQKSALAQSENTLARYPRPAEYNDLSISGAV
jgi:hypothetical protein